LDDDNSVIESGSGGWHWSLKVEDATLDTEISEARFMFLIPVNPILYPVGKICNDFNNTCHVGAAQYILADDDDEDRDTLLAIDLEVSFVGGVATDWIVNQLMLWDIAVSAGMAMSTMKQIKKTK
jgi:hypothetical protein